LFSFFLLRISEYCALMHNWISGEESSALTCLTSLTTASLVSSRASNSFAAALKCLVTSSSWACYSMIFLSNSKRDSSCLLIRSSKNDYLVFKSSFISLISVINQMNLSFIRWKIFSFFMYFTDNFYHWFWNFLSFQWKSPLMRRTPRMS